MDGVLNVTRHARGGNLTLKEHVVQPCPRRHVEIVDLECIRLHPVDDIYSHVQFLSALTRETRQHMDAQLKAVVPDRLSRTDEASDVVAAVHGSEDVVATALKTELDAHAAACRPVRGKEIQFGTVHAVRPRGDNETIPIMKGNTEIIEFPESVHRGESVRERLEVKRETVCFVASRYEGHSSLNLISDVLKVKFKCIFDTFVRFTGH